jgi:hypothetical protein
MVDELLTPPGRIKYYLIGPMSSQCIRHTLPVFLSLFVVVRERYPILRTDMRGLYSHVSPMRLGCATDCPKPL